jgi:hypothetical protein
MPSFQLYPGNTPSFPPFVRQHFQGPDTEYILKNGTSSALHEDRIGKEGYLGGGRSCNVLLIKVLDVFGSRRGAIVCRRFGRNGAFRWVTELFQFSVSLEQFLCKLFVFLYLKFETAGTGGTVGTVGTGRHPVLVMRDYRVKR